MSATLNPYLTFDGRTAEAMTAYQAALGGELSLMRMGDSPMPVPPEHKDRIMHATLKAPGILIMASDTMPGQPLQAGSSVNLSLNFDSPESQTAAWEALGVGGHVVMPLADQFFGRFGVLVDRFGTSWMFHFSKG